MKTFTHQQAANHSHLGLQLDGWKYTEPMIADFDTYTDSEWKGCDFRIGFDERIAANITITARTSKAKRTGTILSYTTRCRVEIVKDGEPSEFEPATIYSDAPIL